MALKDFIVENKKKIYYAIIALSLVAFLTLSLVYATQASLNYDECEWTISFMQGGFFDMLKSLSESLYNFPLFYIVGYVTYKIAPFGEFWLYLPNIAFTLAGIIVLFLFVKKVKGERLALITIFITCFNFSLVNLCAVTFRPYALMFLLVNLVTYLYYIKMKNHSIKSIMLYGFATLLLMFTHWFGILLVGCFGIFDLILIFTKKQNWKHLLAYIFALVFVLPYVVLVIIKSKYSVTEYWPEDPTFIFIVQTLVLFLDTNFFQIFVFIIASVILGTKLIKHCRKRETFENARIFSFILTVIPFMFAMVFLYSGVINRASSLFVARYFLNIYPYMLIITAYGIDEIWKFILLKKKEIFASVVLSVYAVLLVVNFCGVYVKAFNFINDDIYYRGVADYLNTQEDVQDEETLVIATCGRSWVDYFFTKREFKKPCNVAAMYLEVEYINHYTHYVENGQDMYEEIYEVENIKNFLREYNVIYFYYDNMPDNDETESVNNMLKEEYDMIELEVTGLYKYIKK